MSSKDERVANALRVLVGEPVQPRPVRWWHAYGRIREFPRSDGQAPDLEHQLTVISPSDLPPSDPRVQAGADAWGMYLTSWDHAPSELEKEAVTPEEYRQAEEMVVRANVPGDGGDEDDDQW